MRRPHASVTLGLRQHPDQDRPQRPVLLAVDQEFGEGSARVGRSPSLHRYGWDERTLSRRRTRTNSRPRPSRSRYASGDQLLWSKGRTCPGLRRRCASMRRSRRGNRVGSYRSSSRSIPTSTARSVRLFAVGSGVPRGWGSHSDSGSPSRRFLKVKQPSSAYHQSFRRDRAAPPRRGYRSP
jgi:hypothetical protein